MGKTTPRTAGLVLAMQRVRGLDQQVITLGRSPVHEGIGCLLRELGRGMLATRACRLHRCNEWFSKVVECVLPVCIRHCTRAVWRSAGKCRSITAVLRVGDDQVLKSRCVSSATRLGEVQRSCHDVRVRFTHQDAMEFERLWGQGVCVDEEA